MANKMTKISAWSFHVMKNFRDHRPYNSQFMTLFYRDSPDNNLKQKSKMEYALESILEDLFRIYYWVTSRKLIPVNALICMAEQRCENNLC